MKYIRTEESNNSIFLLKSKLTLGLAPTTYKWKEMIKTFLETQFCYLGRLMEFCIGYQNKRDCILIFTTIMILHIPIRLDTRKNQNGFKIQLIRCDKDRKNNQKQYISNSFFERSTYLFRGFHCSKKDS